MKNRLLLLNLVLVALIAGAGWQLRQNGIESRARAQQMFGRAFKPYPAPVLPPFAVAPAVAAAGYLDVAEKVLFSKDRNPVVVVEAAPVKPLPPLPFFHGLMDLGQGPTIILSAKSGAPHRGYHLGEQIGEFKIVSVDQQSIEFEWDEKPVRRKFEEMIDRADVQTAAAQTPSASGQVGAAPAGTTNLTAAKSTVIAAAKKNGPAAGAEGEIRPCQTDDTSAPGTVVDGYKKLVTKTPFGQVCRWEPVKED